MPQHHLDVAAGTGRGRVVSYLTTLPGEKRLAAEIATARKKLEARQ
jgi:hypothetical protein